MPWVVQHSQDLVLTHVPCTFGHTVEMATRQPHCREDSLLGVTCLAGKALTREPYTGASSLQTGWPVFAALGHLGLAQGAAKHQPLRVQPPLEWVRRGYEETKSKECSLDKTHFTRCPCRCLHVSHSLERSYSIILHIYGRHEAW